MNEYYLIKKRDDNGWPIEIEEIQPDNVITVPDEAGGTVLGYQIIDQRTIHPDDMVARTNGGES